MLAGKKAIVTGGSAGIGAAITTSLVSEICLLGSPGGGGGVCVFLCILVPAACGVEVHEVEAGMLAAALLLHTMFVLLLLLLLLSILSPRN